MTRPPFPTVLDSTIISNFRSCPQRVFLEQVQHWKPKTQSVHLHAGKAFAHGLEVTRRAFYEQGRAEDDAIAAGTGALLEAYGGFECPPDSAKSAARMAGALVYYFDAYPMETDQAQPHVLPSGGRAIEFSFLEPLDLLHPETGDPLLYSGRFDMVADFAGGLFGFDDKTTSSLGASWSRQWDLRSQFTSYVWGARRTGLDLAGFLVRGVSILKTKYETLQAITYRPAWMVELWYQQTLRDVERMIACWESGWWDYNLAEACTEYGGCGFRKICQTNGEQKVTWLEAEFEQRIWNPVTRQETVL